MARPPRRRPAAYLGRACVTLALAILATTEPPASAQAQSRPALTITAIANEGFLVEAAKRRVLIDALFRTGVDGYERPAPQLLGELEAARPPFDDAAFVLATHVHDDHFDPVSVLSYLRASGRSRFLSSPQAVARVRETPGAGAIENRAEGVLPPEGQRLRREHRGVSVQVLNIHHGRTRPVENLGLLVELEGHRLLHIGDSEATAADLRVARVREDRLDVFFVPYWYFVTADGRQAVRDVAAKHVIVMHAADHTIDSVVRRAGGFAGFVAQVRREYPEAIWLDQARRSVTLR